MNTETTLKLIAECLKLNIKVTADPASHQITIAFRYVSMSGGKFIKHTINGLVHEKDIELVREVSAMIAHGKSIVDVEKYISEFVPF